MADEDTPLREPLVESEPAAPPARRATNAALELGRNCAFLLTFSTAFGVGVQQISYAYFLVHDGGYSIQRAAGIGAQSWLLYSVCQVAALPLIGALSDRAGRKPVLLWGVFIDTLVMTMSCIQDGEWWIGSHALMGCFDASATLCNAIIVDSVDAPRGLGDARAVLSRGLGELFVVGGIGRLLGYGLGALMMSHATLRGAALCAGLVQVPALLFLAARLPETAARGLPASPGKQIGGACRAWCGALPGMLFRSYHTVLLLVSFVLIGISLSGTFGFVLFWGQVKFDFLLDHPWMYPLTVSPLFGCALAYGGANHSPLGLSKTLAALCVLSAVACALVGWRAQKFLAHGVVTSTGYMVASVAFAGLAWGVFPVITAALAQQVPPAEQGHLMGAVVGAWSFGAAIGIQVYVWYLEQVRMHHELDATTRALLYDFACANIWWINFWLLLAGALAALIAGDQPYVAPKVEKKKDEEAGERVVTLQTRGTVYFKGADKQIEVGYSVAYGGKGEATGPATNDKREGKSNALDVIFPGNKGVVSCLLSNLSYTEPPVTLQTRGTVYFIGPTKSLLRDTTTGEEMVGYSVEYGGKGEVAGDATNNKREQQAKAAGKANALDVMFLRNKGVVSCLLTNLSRYPPPFPSPFENDHSTPRK
jgi:MFS family permease